MYSWLADTGFKEDWECFFDLVREILETKETNLEYTPVSTIYPTQNALTAGTEPAAITTVDSTILSESKL